MKDGALPGASPRGRGWRGAMFGVVAIAGSALAAQGDAPAYGLGDCVACHGADGLGKAQQYPDLRGQKAYYLEKQLRAFRNGQRKDAAMNAVARNLTDAEIAGLAAYFSMLE